ncbi:MAG: hypothetical protein OXL38_08385 [Gammaproteobacteria bacterium]|nr:hypothetical protein [Gammaproteobacteria bacterium]
MRTTLTLDPDVAAMARRMQRTCGGSFKAVINDALRRGLRSMADPTGPVDATASVRQLKGMAPKPPDPVGLEQMDDAIAKACANFRLRAPVARPR